MQETSTETDQTNKDTKSEELVKDIIEQLGSSPHFDNAEIKIDIAINTDLNSAIADHIKTYSNIINNYETEIKKSLTNRNKHRTVLFVVSILILILTSIATFVLVFLCLHKDFQTAVTILVPTVIEFLTTFIVIPKIITEYLFNKDEENNFYNILSRIMQYDIEIWNKFHDK